MKLYLYDYYKGMWKSTVRPERNLFFRNTHRIFMHEIILPNPLTLAAACWLANMQLHPREDVTRNLLEYVPAPSGVVVKTPVELSFAEEGSRPDSGGTPS